MDVAYFSQVNIQVNKQYEALKDQEKLGFIGGAKKPLAPLTSRNCKLLHLQVSFHCNKLEIFLSNLEIGIADFFEPGFLVKFIVPVVVKYGKPDLIKIQFLGFFQ